MEIQNINKIDHVVPNPTLFTHFERDVCVCVCVVGVVLGVCGDGDLTYKGQI